MRQATFAIMAFFVLSSIHELSATAQTVPPRIGLPGIGSPGAGIPGMSGLPGTGIPGTGIPLQGPPRVSPSVGSERLHVLQEPGLLDQIRQSPSRGVRLPLHQPSPYGIALPAQFSKTANSPIEEVAASWHNLQRAFDRHRGSASWKKLFTPPKSLSSWKLSQVDLERALRIVRFVNQHDIYHEVSRLPEFQRLHASLRQFQKLSAAKPTQGRLETTVSVSEQEPSSNKAANSPRP